MNSIILEKELEENNCFHEIFENQNIDDLNTLKRIISKSDKDIAIELNEEDFINNENNDYEYIITKMIIKHIRDKYRNMEIPNEQINRDKVFEYIRLVNPKEARLHIFNNYHNELLFEELLKYVDDNVPFATMIYTNNDLSKEEYKVLSRKK